MDMYWCGSTPYRGFDAPEEILVYIQRSAAT
jgi:hypothetical protein